MIGRSFLALCALILFVCVTNINAATVEKIPFKQLHSKSQLNFDELIDVSIENNNSILEEILKVLQELFGKAAVKCLKAAFEECKENLTHPKDFVMCAKHYLDEHSEECAVSRGQSLDVSIENNKALTKNILEEILKILQELFGKAAVQCLKAAFEECKEDLTRPMDFVMCAKHYLDEHIEECALARGQLLDVSIENNNALTQNIIHEVIEIIKNFFLVPVENCLKQAANTCKQFWYSPKKLIICTKDYFKENIEVCGALEEKATECNTSEVKSLSFQKEIQIDESFQPTADEQDNGVIDVILNILKKFFIDFAENCLLNAANECKIYWYHPAQLLNCAKDYLKENGKDCIAPEH